MTLLNKMLVLSGAYTWTDPSGRQAGVYIYLWHDYISEKGSWLFMHIYIQIFIASTVIFDLFFWVEKAGWSSPGLCNL